MSADSYRVTIKDAALAVTAAGDPESIYTYDRAGRLFAAWVDRRFYRRGLDGRIVEKSSVREDGWRITHRRTLDPREAGAFLQRASRTTGAAATALERGAVELLWTAAAPESSVEAQRLVRAAAGFDAEAAANDARRFADVYRPVGILPPDQYLALVVQLTTGCHWNRCTFCTFYRAQPFAVKSLPEFEAHLRDVTAYLGDGAALRHSLFLGEANALCLPIEDLVLRLDLVRRWFVPDGRGPRSLYAFLDVFTGRRKTAGEYAELRAQGLRRVYVGVESGDDALLRFLNKPQRAEHAVDLVRALKAAGLHVGVIVLAGVGGAQFAEAHVAHTLELLHRLPLTAGDLIYLSAFVSHPHSDYERAAHKAGIRPLGAVEVAAQLTELRRGLRFGPQGPRVARYDIEDFIY